MHFLRLHDVPFELVPREVRLLMITAPAGLPSAGADDLEEPADLGSRLIQHPAASYVTRLAGKSMTGAEIDDGDVIGPANRSRRSPVTLCRTGPWRSHAQAPPQDGWPAVTFP